MIKTSLSIDRSHTHGKTLRPTPSIVNIYSIDMTKYQKGFSAESRSGQVEDRRLSLAFLRIEAHHLKNLLGHLGAERQADKLLGRLHRYRKVVRPFTARQALRYGAGFFRRHLSAQQLLARRATLRNGLPALVR